MSPKLRNVLIGAGVVLLLIQFVPVERSNPPANGTVEAPAEVMEILQTSCFDCHSNETEWPFYAYVAPISWLVAHDVNEGREHLEFTGWDGYSENDRAHAYEEVVEMVSEGEMPLWYYTPLHPSARLTDQEADALLGWAEKRSGRTEHEETLEEEQR